MSPNFFKFTKRALDAFYFNETNRDPRMAFLCLYPLNQSGYPEFGAGGGNTHSFCEVRVSFLFSPFLIFFLFLFSFSLEICWILQTIRGGHMGRGGDAEGVERISQVGVATVGRSEL